MTGYSAGMAKRKSSTITRVRSAVTGRFVPSSRAKSSPRETITERFRRPSSKKRSSGKKR